MSLNGLKYDNGTYSHQLRESVSPGDYMLGTPRPCDPCFVSSPGVPLGGFGASLCEKNIVDVSSELLNITRKVSDCPSKKYIPQAEPFCKGTNYKECSFLTPEDTLLSNPKCTGKEATVNRWEWLCRQPQDKAIVPFPWFISNRLVVKDNHRPLVCKPMDQSASLPSMAPIAGTGAGCSSELDAQFMEGDWTKQANNYETLVNNGSMYPTTCKKIANL